MLKESISGVRGIVGAGFTPEVVERYCLALDRFLPPGPILLARDTRPSGVPISRLISSILNLTGRDVLDAGIQTTPTAEVATEKSEAAGGIIVTASHNPAEWNALKFLRGDGLFLDDEDFRKLHDVMDISAKWSIHSALGSLSEFSGAAKMHIEAIKSLPWLDFAAIRKAGYRVAYDANGGAGAAAMLPLLEELGCEVVEIGCELDGNFAHPAEPKPENLAKLATSVWPTTPTPTASRWWTKPEAPSARNIPWQSARRKPLNSPKAR